MTELHTRRAFGEQLEAVQEMVLRLGELVCGTIAEASRTLLDSDLEGARRLIEADDVIDASTIEIEDRCFQLLVLESPMAGDLRTVISALRCASEIERLGDHAVNIGERVRYQVSGWKPGYDGAIRAEAGRAVVPASLLPDVPPVVDRGVVVADEAERRRVEALRRDFVANIGHELRTPVGALVVLAETLRSELEELEGIEASPTVRRLSERLTYEAARLGRTIDDLLELSRIEAGEVLVRTELPVGEVVADALERTAPAAELTGAQIEVRMPDASVVVSGDRRQLVSALGNLIDNAVKYSGPGGTVEVSVDTTGRGVRFVVRDHGIGIPGADQVRIFERFYRVDRARRRDTGGTGLGLAIVRHVALNHGGTVEVSSTEGEGATFTLTIPPPDRDAP